MAAAPILVVEGPGCAQVASAVLAGIDCLDWGELEAQRGSFAGRDVQLWSLDTKVALKVAASLLGQCRSVAVVDTRPEGLSLSAALKDRMTGEALLDFMRARLQAIQPPEVKKKGNGRDVARRSPKAGDGTGAAFGVWQSLGLHCNAQGFPIPNIANMAAILALHPDSKNRLWFNTLTRKIMQTVDGADSQWSDAEDLRVCEWLQNALRVDKVAPHTVFSAIQLVAFNNARNPLTDWLSALEWDGTTRLETWLSDFFEAPQSAYAAALGRNWLVSMVARAFRPGCKADHMPVLEGKMGRGKSEALAVLGGAWYKAAPQAFGSKEFFEAIQGAWLIEIPDMVGFGRREHSQIISAITTRSDTYRASYARHADDHPRTCIFAATSEDDEYLQDARGIRRYWPLRCSAIDLHALAAARDQLFAEATSLFKAGANWHEMPEVETTTEQQGRVEIDVWLERVSGFAASRSEMVVMDVAEMALEMRASDVGRAEQMRIAKCLKALGYSCKVEWTAKGPQRVYRRR